MKTLLSITLFFSVLISSALLAQDLTGVATYKTQRKVDMELDDTQMDSEMKTQVMAMLKKQFEREYELAFKGDESLYKEVEKLDAPGNNPSGMQMLIVNTDGGDILYKNLKENRYTNQNEVFSKEFLIQDVIEEPEWELHKETKNIGEYTCFKATFKRMVAVMNSVRSSNDDDTDNTLAEESEEEQTVTAWYTPQIPISHGPNQYGGLPGLILEIGDGQQTILCSKIVLNPKKEVNVEEPKGGKKVNQAEFEAIMDKKMREQMEQFENSRQDGEDGERIEIRIGG